MNTEKLKAHECRFCKSMTDNEYCVRTKEDCRYLYIAEDFRKGLPDLWEPHPDIAEAMQPETTELKITTGGKDGSIMAHRILVTCCCSYGPITNENFCPSCGRRIKK